MHFASWGLELCNVTFLIIFDCSVNELVHLCLCERSSDHPHAAVRLQIVCHLLFVGCANATCVYLETQLLQIFSQFHMKQQRWTEPSFHTMPSESPSTALRFHFLFQMWSMCFRINLYQHVRQTPFNFHAACFMMLSQLFVLSWMKAFDMSTTAQLLIVHWHQWLLTMHLTPLLLQDQPVLLCLSKVSACCKLLSFCWQRKVNFHSICLQLIWKQDVSCPSLVMRTSFANVWWWAVLFLSQQLQILLEHHPKFLEKFHQMSSPDLHVWDHFGCWLTHDNQKPHCSVLQNPLIFC